MTSDEQLASYRASIDNIDAALVHLLAERFKVTQAVGRYKAAAGLPPADPDREEQQIERLRTLAEQSGLDPAFTEAFLRFIVSEVIRHHERLAAELEVVVSTLTRSLELARSVRSSSMSGCAAPSLWRRRASSPMPPH